MWRYIRELLSLFWHVPVEAELVWLSSGEYFWLTGMNWVCSTWVQHWYFHRRIWAGWAEQHCWGGHLPPEDGVLRSDAFIKSVWQKAANTQTWKSMKTWKIFALQISCICFSGRRLLLTLTNALKILKIRRVSAEKDEAHAHTRLTHIACFWIGRLCKHGGPLWQHSLQAVTPPKGSVFLTWTLTALPCSCVCARVCALCLCVWVGKLGGAFDDLNRFVLQTFLFLTLFKHFVLHLYEKYIFDHYQSLHSLQQFTSTTNWLPKINKHTHTVCFLLCLQLGQVNIDVF